MPNQTYSYSYQIGDIVDSLNDHCKTHHLDPKRTYIWIDCLCINQHRVAEQKECGGTGMLNFEEEFPKTLKTIGHMLAMMSPWNAPIYLTRLWCIFEMHAAHTNECKINIIMPPTEKKYLEQDVIERGGGINILYEALGNTRVQNADASVDNDKITILGMIESTVGYEALNEKVNDLLRGWMKHVLMQLLENRDDKTDESRAEFCQSICVILGRNGEEDAAMEQYHKSLAIQEHFVGKYHPSTAMMYSNIGFLMEAKGEFDAALEHHTECLRIRKSLLGKDHPDTANCLNDIGNVLKAKGDYDGAMEHYQRCLAIRKFMLWKQHPETSSCLDSIASLTRMTKK